MESNELTLLQAQAPVPRSTFNEPGMRVHKMFRVRELDDISSTP